MTPVVKQSSPALLCWDGSEAAIRAIRSAASLVAEPRRALVLFAHVPAKSVRGFFSGSRAAGTPISDAEAEDTLDWGVRIAREAGFDAAGVRVASVQSAAEAITRAAEQEEVSLIVLGQPQRAAVDRLVLGSVAQQVLGTTHRPVVLVGGSQSGEASTLETSPGQRADRPAVICWDGSEGAVQAIEQTALILGPGHPAIILFAHVPTEQAGGILGGASAPDAPIMGSADAEALIDTGMRRAREARLEPTALRIVAERKTAEVITEVADAQDALLIAMGQRRRSAIGRVLLGSVTREVVALHHRPVMLTGPAGPGPYPHPS